MSRPLIEKMAKVQPGDIDLLSKTAYYARISTCTAVNVDTGSSCTRAAGHDENRPGHPSSGHVCTGLGFVTLEVWRS